MATIDYSLIKAVVTDIDGTIMQEGTSALNPCYFDIIKQLRAAGYHVIIASGRQQESIEHLFVPVLEHIDIISSGGLCIKSESGVEMQEPIPQQWVHEMEEDIEQLSDVDGLFNSIDISYAQHPDGAMSRFLRDSYKINLHSLEGTGCLPDIPIGKVSIYSGSDVARKGKTFVDKWSQRLSVTMAGDFWIDCVMPEVNKASAIQKLLCQYGLTTQQLLASGDQMNDYQMLKLAGQSIAVSNARDELKQIATCVLPNEDYLAVARAWTHLL